MALDSLGEIQVFRLKYHETYFFFYNDVVAADGDHPRYHHPASRGALTSQISCQVSLHCAVPTFFAALQIRR